ncbi:ABC transporter permease [Thiohalophilus sp.]|uniref:ABC transporter permease n=1 Tax=Thiohalophilus sp. TaxID=3028392 RepID=UPI003A0FEF08
MLFLGEAVVLSALGGLVRGIGSGQLLQLMLPVLPVQPTWGFVILAESIAIIIGLLAGVLPAQRAARLDPVEALRAE